MRCLRLDRVVLPLFVLMVLLQGCGEGQPTPVSSPKVPPKARPDQTQVALLAPTPEKPMSPGQEVENYTYDPEGRPDPFKSILIAGIPKDLQLIPPLQQREITEMKVIAIIWGGLGQSAMLQTPDGRGYTVTLGTRVGPNKGVVKKITPWDVIVEERYTDFFGENKTREVILELRPGGEKIE